MKLHIPVLLRKALLACFAVGTLYSGGTTIAADLTLGSEDTLSINYAESDSISDLESGTLQLNGDTLLLLAECGEGNGKTYTLLTGVSGLLDKDGNALALDSSNNAASQYFDTTQPGTGFWADATLQLTTDGTLQLVRHNETVKDAVTITTRQIGGAGYQYYEGVSFKDINSTSASGGAIYEDNNRTITLSGNGSVTFSGNTASSSSSYGGAIYGYYNSTITLSGNGSVTFSGNTASASDYAFGGAIYGHINRTITLSGNESVTFSGNTASSVVWASYGGAICGYYDSTITLSGNGSVTFSGNTASSSAYASYGGAIYGDNNRTITLSGNGSVTFSGNTASSPYSYARGGAIYGDNSSTITLSGNGSVTFSGNTASSSTSSTGGAIYSYGAVTITGNDEVTFSGNTASSSSSSYGGAIYSIGIVIITGNDEVTFAQNVEKSGSTYRLRSLYMAGVSSSDKLTLSAGEKQSIRFYDSVYMGAKGSVALNADYTDAEGATQKATGTILFSGATTEDDLKDAKGGVAGTEEEILNSRTSEINSAATLYGGTLQVQDKAVLKLNGGLTVADGSKASVQVQAAELNVGSHALNMVSGSSLLLSDGAKLTATELTISNGAELAVKAITANSPVQNLSAAFTIDTTPSTGYDASRAYNVLAGGKIDAALLTLAAGATYTANAANVSLSDGELTLAITSTATKRIELNLTLSADYDPAAQVVLFSDVTTVNFIKDGLTAKSTDGAVYTLSAADYFNSVWINNMTTLVYDSNQKVVYLEGVSNVPEPTTSTLSLLALAALAARRRRK